MFNFINESKNILIGIDSLNGEQLEEFKKWMITTNDTSEKSIRQKILSIMDQTQHLKYVNDNISDSNYIKNKEAEQEKERFEQLERSYEVKMLILEMENSRELYDYVSNLVNSLIRKKHRGEELNIEKLANSSVIADLIRRSMKSFEKHDNEKIYLSKDLRKAAKMAFARNILTLVDEWE